jgi:hypothetical protein
MYLLLHMIPYRHTTKTATTGCERRALHIGLQTVIGPIRCIIMDLVVDILTEVN